MCDEKESNKAYALIHTILAWRQDRKKNAKQLAALRKGADSTTESYAVPYVFPALAPDTTVAQRTALLRACAMAAEFADIPAFTPSEKCKRKTFGAWCHEVSKAYAKAKGKDGGPNLQDPDTVGQRLAYLDTQDLDEAAKSVMRIMQIASGLSPAPSLDYIDLYRMLSYWGNGITSESRERRLRPLRDYYGNFDLNADAEKE